MNIDVLEKNKKEIKFKITIENKSLENYVLPIDTAGFKIYMSEDKCSEFLFLKNYPDLGFIAMVSQDNVSIEADLASKGCFSSLTEAKDLINSIKKREKGYKKNQQEILNAWKNQFQLYNKKDEWIKINYYLFNHLKIIKSKENITFIKSINFDKINEQPDVHFYNFYPIKENLNYEFFLKTCIDRSIFEYLTEEQKEQFKNSIFFNGQLNSNKIEFSN